MGLFYKNQQTVPLIGTRTEAGTRTPIALTSAYQAVGASAPTKVLMTGGYSKLNLDINYTMGATETANSIEVMIESSPDNVNFYRIANDSTSGATSTLTAREFTFVGTNAAAATIGIFLDVAYKFVRVSCKESGVATNAGSVYVEATLSGI